NQVHRDSLFEQFKLDPSTINLTPIKEDSILRAQVALEDKYNLVEQNTDKVGMTLFPPISGTVTQGYDSNKKHYAVDVVAPLDTPVKAVADGIVIFSEWTSDTGYVILLEHSGGMLSVYKHNGSLSKGQGDVVRA